jgi:D-3-phosphoglycerate dehydrogenase
MIGPSELEAMAPGAFLINASRGQVVDIEALRSALLDGHVGGAAIDVFPVEPASRGEAFASALQGLENVILSPHIGGSTQEAQANIGREVSEAVVRYLESGHTVGSVTLPQLDVSLPADSSRIVNVHQNVPGVLSSINHLVAELNVNIVGQHLRTLEEIGLLYVDMALERADPQAQKLATSIAALPTSLRTRLV